MKRIVFGLIVVLALLHQDFWWWYDAEPFVFGFLPIGLAYHAGISLSAGVLWALAIRYCWPEHLDALDRADDVGSTEGQSA